MKTVAYCLALLFCILSPAAWAADVAPKCGLVLMTELPVDISQGRLLVKMQIDGHDAMFLVDTGSAFNMLSRHMVEVLNLHPALITPSMKLMDAAGATMNHFVKVKTLTVNGMVAEDKEFAVMGENNTADAPFDGIFGAGFLAAYDVELDLPHGKIRLFSQDHCKGQVVYWTQDYAVLPFTVDASLHAVMQATLDGHSLPTMLDTGATPSTLSAQVARRDFNFDPAAAGVEPDGKVFGGSGTSMPYYKHRFANLNLGGVEFHNTEFEVIPDRLSHMIRDHQRLNAQAGEQQIATALTIGLHHLTRIRAYIAYGEQKIYISAADAQ